mgnify:FL=1|jgi:hypothetical protein
MSGVKDWVTVIPGPGELKNVVRELLALALDPRDVRTQGNGDEFLVPQELADRFLSPTPAPVKRRARKPKEDES